MPIKTIITPAAALIPLISSSGKVCLEYLIMLRIPSMISHVPKPTSISERTFK